MNKWVSLGALVLIAGCEVSQAPVTTGPNGQQYIQINTSGLTCYQNRCMDINPAYRSVRTMGYNATRIPGNIDVSDGKITPEEFKQLSVVSLMAGGEGSGDR